MTQRVYVRVEDTYWGFEVNATEDELTGLTAGSDDPVFDTLLW